MGFSGGVQSHPEWTALDRLINGANSDLSGAEFAYKRAERAYEESKARFLAAGELLDKIKAHHARVKLMSEDEAAAFLATKGRDGRPALTVENGRA